MVGLHSQRTLLKNWLHLPYPIAVEAWVGKGQHLKRISMHGRGRSGRRLRYRSHLTVRPNRWVL